jgi:predicted ABC-type ATPase
MKPSLIVVAGPNGAGKTTITKIINRYYRSINNCVKAVAMADRSYFYDNSINNIDPTQLFRTVNGKIVKFYNELAPWAKDVSEQLAGE